MKITRANVEEYAKQKGLERVEVDGVIDGFAWKEPDLQIGNKLHKGITLIFTPLAEWDKGIAYA